MSPRHHPAHLFWAFYAAEGSSTTTTTLPSGSRSMNISGAPGGRNGWASRSMSPIALRRVLAQDVGRLDADRAAAGLAAHRWVERQARGGARRGHLQPAHLALLAEAPVAADLEAELLGVEGQGRVLVGNREHHDANVRQGGGGLREIVHALKTTRGAGNHRSGLENAAAGLLREDVRVAMTETTRLAVLIDSDNTTASLTTELLAEIAKYGTPTIKRAYGDWTTQHLVGWKEELLRHAIQPVQSYSDRARPDPRASCALA
jgi:hypothetical protein